MLAWLAELSPHFGPLNLFRYITFRTGGAVFTALFFVFFFGPRIIAALRLKQGKGQPIRQDGPQSHLLTKKGTPTMGGLMILSGLVVSTLLWANLRNHYVWIVLLVMTGFGAIGFYDDYLKVTRQTHAGFSGRSGWRSKPASRCSPASSCGTTAPRTRPASRCPASTATSPTSACSLWRSAPSSSSPPAMR